MRIDRVLVNAQQAHAAITEVFQSLKPYLLAGHQFSLSAKPKTRSNKASAKFHAMCGDFSRSGIKWDGKERTLSEWKVLLISGHSVATKEGVEVVLGLENEYVNIRESSAQMSVARTNSLIEYTYAMGVEIGVKFTCPEEIAA